MTLCKDCGARAQMWSVFDGDDRCRKCHAVYEQSWWDKFAYCWAKRD